MAGQQHRHPQADAQVIIFFFPFNALLLPLLPRAPAAPVGSGTAGQPDGIGISARRRRPVSILGGKHGFLDVGEAQLQHGGTVAAQPLLPACPELRKTQNPARTSHFPPNVSIALCSEQGAEGQQGPRAVSWPGMCWGQRHLRVCARPATVRTFPHKERVKKKNQFGEEFGSYKDSSSVNQTRKSSPVQQLIKLERNRKRKKRPGV